MWGKFAPRSAPQNFNGSNFEVALMKLPFSPTILANLPDCAPKIIREVNPVTWIERIIHEGHEYKLAREQIRVQSEKEQKELQLELEKLNAQKEVYLASIDNERKLIAEGNKPTIAALNAFFDNLNTYDKQSQQILDKILESTGKIEPEFFDRLMTLYETIHNKREAICKNIQQTLEGNRQSLRDQLQAINAKVINQKALR